MTGGLDGILDDDPYPPERGSRRRGDRRADDRYDDEPYGDDQFADDQLGGDGYDDDRYDGGRFGRDRYDDDDADDRDGDEDGGGPRGPRPGRALPKLIAVLLVVAALLGLGIYGVGKVVGRFSGGSPAADYTGTGEGIAVVQVPNGATARDIAQELRDANVTASTTAFVKAASADPRSLGIQPGTYRLRTKMSARSALAALLDPASSAPFRFVIKEGETVKQVLAGLHERLGTPMEDLEAIAKDPKQLGLPSYATGLEGYLFPSTYDLVPGQDATALLKSFVARFTSETAAIGLEAKAASGGLDPAKVVIIASIIEKEVANKDEGPKVARVIYNRLNDKTGAFTRLDMDSTTRYALDEYEGPLSDAQLHANNPYNTRAVRGLPPGAISNPGIWALKSALEPAPGPWFYFVSMPQSKVTKFATTSEEFAQLQQQYRDEGGRE